MIQSYKLEEYSQLSKNFEYVKEEFNSLRELLSKFKTRNGEGVEVFLQGSYKNKTSINSSSDIDIVVFLDWIFNSNLNGISSLKNDCPLINKNHSLSADDCIKHALRFSRSDYSEKDFKNELKLYLEENGSDNYSVTEGKKTIKCVMKRGNNFSFDIVPVIEYRFYSQFENSEDYLKGNFLSTKQGERVINFPIEIYRNSKNKNQETALNYDGTGGTYKETVRIFKNISNHHLSEDSRLSSFVLESILFNVPSYLFKEADKRLRCQNVIQSAISKVNYHWDEILEPNKLLFVKNIKNVTREKALLSLRQIESLL